MDFYAEIKIDKTSEIIGFRINAPDTQGAMTLLAVYCKGLFEGSGIGADIERLGKTKARGVEYRGL